MQAQRFSLTGLFTATAVFLAIASLADTSPLPTAETQPPAQATLNDRIDLGAVFRRLGAHGRSTREVDNNNTPKDNNNLMKDEPRASARLYIRPDESPISIKHEFMRPRESNVEHSRVRVTQDLIFLDDDRVLINTDHLKMYKGFDISDLAEVVGETETLKERHALECSRISKLLNDDSSFEYFRISADHQRAKELCAAKSMILPYASNRFVAEELQAFMNLHNFTEVHAGVHFNKAKTTIADDQFGAEVLKSIEFCGDAPGKVRDIVKHHGFDGRNNDKPFSYFITSRRGLQLCVNKEEFLPVVCAKRYEGHMGHFNSYTKLCDSHMKDIANTLGPLKEAVTDLQNTINPSQDNAKHISLMDRYVIRNKRAIFAYSFFTIISIVLSVATYLRLSAVHVHHTNEMGRIALKSNNVAAHLESLKNGTYTILDDIQRFDFLRDNEITMYTTFVRMLSALQDSIIVFHDSLNSIKYNQLTSQILSDSEIKKIDEAIMSSTGNRVVPDKAKYTVRPVLIDNKLAVEISIPILDKSREARLYEVRHFPRYINGTKTVPVCDTKYLAIYEHESSYNLLTANEYNICKNNLGPCTAQTPKYSEIIENCATSQYFARKEHSRVRHVKAQDQAPFYLSTGHLTVYAVDENVRVTFHCPHIHQPGPDMVIELNGRGNFTTPGGCTFKTDFMSFRNPSSHLLSSPSSSIRAPFPLSSPDINTFPTEPVIFNIDKPTGELTLDPITPHAFFSDSPSPLVLAVYISLALSVLTLSLIGLYSLRAFFTNMFFSCIPCVSGNGQASRPNNRPKDSSRARPFSSSKANHNNPADYAQISRKTNRNPPTIASSPFLSRMQSRLQNQDDWDLSPANRVHFADDIVTFTGPRLEHQAISENNPLLAKGNVVGHEKPNVPDLDSSANGGPPENPSRGSTPPPGLETDDDEPQALN